MSLIFATCMQKKRNRNEVRHIHNRKLIPGHNAVLNRLVSEVFTISIYYENKLKYMLNHVVPEGDKW